MAECIEREKVKEMLIYNWDECCSAVIGDLESIPAADVVGRKTGRWFIDGNGTLRCSECKEEALLTLDAIEGVPFSTFSKSHFCPHCGAKMEGDNIDEIV